MTDSYQANYDRIAQDHIAWWRIHGTNPFQPQDAVDASNAATVALIRRHLPPGSWVLDAGCGMADVLAACPEYERYGVDISSDYLEIAAERGIDVKQAPVEKIPFRALLFRAVLCLDVLEHVLDLNAACRELLRVLRPGGLLILRTPDSEDLTPYLTGPYEFVHLRRFDEPTFRLLFTRVFGCEIVEVGRTQSELLVVVRKP